MSLLHHKLDNVGHAATRLSSPKSSVPLPTLAASATGVPTQATSLLVSVALALIPTLASAADPTPASPAHSVEPAAAFDKTVAPYLKKYCLDCHGEKKQEGGLAFHRFQDFASAQKDRKTWQRVNDILEASAMPPEKAKSRPTGDETKAVLAWINSILHVDCSKVHDPGRVTIRRLNRAEYNNTVRDLLGIEFQPARDFPSDDVGYGFDNIGDVLSLPPLLMERYMDAAEEIAAQAVAGDDNSFKRVQSKVSRELSTKGKKERDAEGFYLLTSDGGVFSEFEFRFAGEYIISAEAAADQAGPDPARMMLRIADKEIQTHDILGQRKTAKYETKVKIGPGERIETGRYRVSASFINDYYQPDESKPDAGDRNLRVRSIEVRGPLHMDGTPPDDKNLRVLFTKPGSGVSGESAARSIFLKFATRAYRRPVADTELDGLVKLVTGTVSDGATFERAVQLGVQAVLVSPHFLFRAEYDKQPDNPTEHHVVGDYELASRLSYFLWSSMPDEQLFELAAAGKLHDRAVLEQQVARMLDDPKSASLVQNFGAQWLNLGILDQSTPSPVMFPDWDNQLRSDMRRETEMLFEAVMRENRSIFDFLDADFTFINERLAKHYGIANVTGNDFQRVSLAGTTRAGVLTHASVLTLTSGPGRTKPVKRGKWILENILGTAPPPPPPNVPGLAEPEKGKPAASLREQLALHRSNANCASCHEVMDPVGLGFENFDPIGRWRDKDGERAIESAGSLPSGETFKDPRELISLVRKREFDYSRHFAETMLTFALGRGLEYYDSCTVDAVVNAIAGDGYRFRRLVTEIVKSDAFLKRRGDGGRP